MALSWSRVTAPLALPVLGYVVQMIDPVTDEWMDLLDASDDPDRLSHVKYGATTGETYSFRVFAVNFNGRSALAGSQVSILACGLPRHMDQPVYVTSSRTSITLRWSPPIDDGGCPAYDYAVYLAGTGAGPWTEVNPAARSDPSLDEFSCEIFPAGSSLGDRFLFKIVASNQQGSVESFLSAPMLWAGVPAKPSAAPRSDPLVTDRRQIKVDYPAVSDDGGAPVLTYELQMGSPRLDDWVTIAGGEPRTLSLSYTVTKGLVRGEDYTFRYRAVN